MNLRSARGELVGERVGEGPDRRSRPPLVPALFLLLQFAALGGVGYLLVSLFG